MSCHAFALNMNINQDILDTFCKWLISSKFPIAAWTNEKTLQNQLGLFLNYWLPRSALVELEVNIDRLLGSHKQLAKMEADIVVTDRESRSGIEVKFWRDQGSYNIGMFKCYEDIRFLEDLRSCGFGQSALLFFTEVRAHYTKVSAIPQPKNMENYDLHKTFRYDQQLSGTVRIKTGKMDQTISISGNYHLNWKPLAQDVWYVTVMVT